MIAIQADGAYLVGPDGRETRIDGAAIVLEADGSVTLRVAAADVELRDRPVDAECYDQGRADLVDLVAIAVAAELPLAAPKEP